MGGCISIARHPCQDTQVALLRTSPDNPLTKTTGSHLELTGLMSLNAHGSEIAAREIAGFISSKLRMTTLLI